MTYPTADMTVAVETWMRSQEDLRFLLDEAVQQPEIAEALAEVDLSAVEARAAILENPVVLARLRTARNPRQTLVSNRPPGRDLGVDAKRLVTARPLTRIIVASSMVFGYVVLFTAASEAMPWAVDLFCFVAFVAMIALALILGGEDIRIVLKARRNARDHAEWRRSMMKEIVLPELRQFIDERRKPSYHTELVIKSLHNLYRDDDEAPIIITESGQHLRRILARSTSDAVAIAGTRGVGKTTAIHAAARGLFSDPGAPPPMPLIVSAPSRYDARDFVLHLHAVLAKLVIAKATRLVGERVPNEHEVDPEPDGRVKRAVRWLVRRFVFPLVLVGIAYLLWDKPYARVLADWHRYVDDIASSFPDGLAKLLSVEGPDNELRARLLLLIAVIPVGKTALELGVGFTGWFLGQLIPLRGLGVLLSSLDSNGRQELLDLREGARRQLDRIRFLQTYTTGWSGKVAAPFGGELGWARGAQRAEQQLTHPEVVDAFRKFAEWSASVLIKHGSIERLVIAIDELDKIAEEDKAHEFINDVKGIFGVEGCLFLVAVSDDAVSAFERRGIPVRDAFDSAFSEMVRMDSFTIVESRRWMSRRLLGVPQPFSHLCHCLSGGLPRDLRRSTIDMIDSVRETGKRDLGSIVRALVDRELARKAHAFAAAARQLRETPELTAYLTHLLQVNLMREPAELVAIAAQVAPGPSSELSRIRWQTACFLEGVSCG